MASIELPKPETDSSTSVERAIATRASRRSFTRTPVTLTDVSQLLWAAQGVTHVREGTKMRTAPSAGATYPLTALLEVAPEGCPELEPGLYRYASAHHCLESELETAIHGELTRAALDQEVLRDAPATIVLASNTDRTRQQYPDHGDRYVHMEAGHAAQNVQLVCESRDLCSCPVGAFSDDDVAAVLELSARLEALYLVPFGHGTTDQ